jgi:hypothetical protein
MRASTKRLFQALSIQCDCVRRAVHRATYVSASSNPRRSPRKSPNEVVKLTEGACFVNFLPAFNRASRFCEQNLATSTLGTVTMSSSLSTNNRALFHSSRKACRYSRVVEEPGTSVGVKLLENVTNHTCDMMLLSDLGNQ